MEHQRANQREYDYTQKYGKFQHGEIYRIWFANDPSGKSYIGHTILPGGSYESVMQHINDAKEGRRVCPLLDDATRRFGYENLRWQVLENDITTRQELDKAERAYIDIFHTLAPRGYNLPEGGVEDAFTHGSGTVGRIVNRLFKRTTRRAANRATWRTFGMSFYDLRDISKIAQELFGSVRR